MKKSLIFMIILLIIATSTNAQQRRVRLGDAHSKEQLQFDFCNIFVTKEDIDNEGNSKVIIEIENRDESNVIILFGRSYLEKDLKQLSPKSISFDKHFPGTKGDRNIDAYREARNDFIVDPSEKCKLPEIQVENSETYKCRIPLYIAKYKEKSFLSFLGIGSNGKNKLLLMEKQVLELEIENIVKPDENYIRLDNAANELIEKIGKQTFCTNTRHKPSLKEQKALYKEKIDKIKYEIEEIILRNRWFSQDKEYRRYGEIKQKLDNIDWHEGDCGKHSTPITRHNCKYCNLSLQEIYYKIDDYYKKIYNSNNRKSTKDAVMADVNLLYKCCTDGKCAKHAPSWKSSEYKSKIIDRYNRISNF